jgi:hypothetical protein
MLCVDVQPPKLALQMSYVPDQQQPPQWSRSEQVRGKAVHLGIHSKRRTMADLPLVSQLTLLTTILKDLDPDPASTLFHLIQQRGWQPRWQDIPLPEGESFDILSGSSENSYTHLACAFRLQ